MPESLKRVVSYQSRRVEESRPDTCARPRGRKKRTGFKIPSSTYRNTIKAQYFGLQFRSPLKMREYLTIDGIHMYYKGDIRQGAVVFLHGSSLNGRIFREQFRHIGAFPMLAIELPGHGHSDWASDPGATYNIPAYARLVVRIARELEMENMILAGHAMGANIAIEAAEGLPALRGLFLFSMCPFTTPPRLDLMCRPNPFLGYLLSGRLRPMEALLLAEEMLETNAALSEELASWILEADMASRMSFAASLGLDRFVDEPAVLRRFAGPLAVLKGKNDRLISSRYLSEALSGVSLWKNGIIELDAGHLPQLEAPQQFNTMIEQFYHDALGTAPAGKEGGACMARGEDSRKSTGL